MIGERTNVTGSAKFRRLIEAGDYQTAVNVALDQVRGGANLLDVNMDADLLDSEQAMTTFLNLLATEPEAARIPVMVDSSRWSVHRGRPEVHAGQGRRQLDQPQGRRGVVPRAGARRSRLRRRRRRHGVRRAGPGRHRRAQGRRSAAAHTTCSTQQAGFAPEDIIFDPNVLAVATGIAEHNGYAKAFIEALPRIKERCPGARTSGGISNLSLRVPRQRGRAPRRCTRRSFTTRSRRAWTWASSTPASSTCTGHSAGAAGTRRGRPLRPPATTRPTGSSRTPSR